MKDGFLETVRRRNAVPEADGCHRSALAMPLWLQPLHVRVIAVSRSGNCSANQPSGMTSLRPHSAADSEIQPHNQPITCAERPTYIAGSNTSSPGRRRAPHRQRMAARSRSSKEVGHGVIPSHTSREGFREWCDAATQFQWPTVATTVRWQLPLGIRHARQASSRGFETGNCATNNSSGMNITPTHFAADSDIQPGEPAKAPPERTDVHRRQQHQQSRPPRAPHIVSEWRRGVDSSDRADICASVGLLNESRHNSARSVS